VVRCAVDSSVSREEPVPTSCEHGIEPSGSIKGGEIVDWMGDY
jgi:hypothetical protein